MANTDPDNWLPGTGRALKNCTESRRGEAGGPEAVASRVRAVLERIGEVGLDLPIFLDAVCWGNEYLVTDGRAKYERSALMHLPQILERWAKKSPRAKSVLESYALSTIKTIITAEMNQAVSQLTVTGEEIGEETLLGITEEGMVNRLKPVTGTLWEILECSGTRKDKSRNKHIHNPQKVRISALPQNWISYVRYAGYHFRDLPTSILPK
jgi:hypothetical protein